MALSPTYAQTLFSPRAVGLGSNGAAVRDTRGFESNPAGLIGMRDWEITTATYSSPSENFGFVFQGITFGKRFLDNEAVAIKFSPGSLLEFVTPTQFVDTSFIDQKISYAESFSFGFAHRFSEQVSVGIGARYREATLTDKQFIVTNLGNGGGQVVPKESNENVILADLSLLWNPISSLSLSVLGKNLVAAKTSEFSSEFKEFSLPSKRLIEIGVKYQIDSQFLLYANVGSKVYGALGYEFLLPALNFGVRNSLYFNKAESPTFYALGVSVGWLYQFLEVEASYLQFFNQTQHSGSGSTAGFDPSKIQSIDLNPHTQNRMTLSLKAIFGNIRESLARIEAVEVTSAVYPSSYELFAFRPIGKVKVRNVSTKPIQARVSFYVEKYMDAPTETPAVYMLPGEEKEIPFNAVLNEQVKSVNKLTIREGNVYVNAAQTEEYDDRFQTKVLIHGRNDWDGDVNSLRHFVTPDDPDVLRYTRDILLQFRDSLGAVPRELEQLAKARLLFNAFAGKLVYVGDPKQSSDYVQYPSETLTLKSGDCDDMTTCFVSLLSSVGISTAFVDVVPPQEPEKSHIYMMFDTELDPKFGNRISENPKRYVIRRNPKGIETIWLPIETTVITKGFDTAWSTGAQEYLEDVEISLGLIKDWVKVVDVN